MIPTQKKKLLNTASSSVTKNNIENTDIASITSFSEMQRTKKLESAKRRVYAISDNLNW